MAEEEKEVKKKDINENVVFVGKKEPKVYSYTVKTIFEKGINEVIVKARGKTITRAIDVVEFLKRNGELDVKSVEIGSEEFELDGKKLKVSTIALTVTKSK